eukprot:3949301-Amphidinium_carterae.1
MCFFGSLRNAFSGALPDTGFMKHDWGGLYLETNQFEGQLPAAAVSPASVEYVVAGNTRIEGSIPSALGALGTSLIAVSMPKLVMEGRIPAALARMKLANSSVVVGHGLIGPLPPIAATLRVFSAFSNKLFGHLPRLKLASQSAIVLHNNHLSCQLPRYEEVRPKFALVLLGNSFTEPYQFPAW